MLIQGQALRSDEMDEIIRQIQELPTGFVSQPKPGLVGEMPSEYREAYDQWQSSKNPVDLQHAVRSLQRTAEKAERTGKSGANSQSDPQVDEQIYRTTGALYKAVAEAAKQQKHAGNVNAAAQLRDRLPELGAQAAAVYPRSRRIVLDKSLQPNVHQGEAGFSIAPRKQARG